jgi:hypothetical protein
MSNEVGSREILNDFGLLRAENQANADARYSNPDEAGQAAGAYFLPNTEDTSSGIRRGNNAGRNGFVNLLLGSITMPGVSGDTAP